MTSVHRRCVLLAVAAVLLGFPLGLDDQHTVARQDRAAAGQPAVGPGGAGLATEPPPGGPRHTPAIACAGDADEAASAEWTQAQLDAFLDAFVEYKSKLADRLSASTTAEHLHLAAVLRQHPKQKVELLERAIARNPHHAFLLWSAVQTCSTVQGTTDCPLQAWQRRLLQIDGENSEAWIRVAANHYRDGDSGAALAALRRAGTSAETRDYWVESVRMIERGLAASTDYPFARRASMAFSLAAAGLPRIGDYVSMCKVQSAASEHWAYACLAYGTLAERQGTTDIGTSIGQSIQRLALDALGDEAGLAEVVARQEARRSRALRSVDGLYPQAEKIMVSNPDLFSAYLAKVKIEGETPAREYLVGEAQRLIETRPQLGCQPVRWAPADALEDPSTRWFSIANMSQ